MNWLPVRTKNFQYSASLTGSLLSSTLKSLSNNQFKLGYTYLYDLPTPGLPGPAIRLEEGKPIGSFFGWRYAGTDAEGNIYPGGSLHSRVPDVLLRCQRPCCFCPKCDTMTKRQNDAAKQSREEQFWNERCFRQKRRIRGGE